MIMMLFSLKLHDKYTDSVDVSPELELMFMLGGSAFHVSFNE